MRGGAFLKGKEGRVGFRKKVRKVSVPCEGNRRGRKDLKKNEMTSFCYLL